MPISAGTNIILRGGQDPDALAYFGRAGIASGTQTPTSYDNAASFNGTSQFLQTASNISFSSGESFSFAGWVNIANTTGRQNIVFVTNPVGDQWISLYADATNQNYNFRCRNANTSVDVSANVLVSPFPSNTYVFVHGQYDALLQKTAVSINNGAFVYSPTTGAPISAISNPIVINGLGQVGATFFQGAISGLGFWKRALTASEVTALFNSGAGRTYASLDSGLLTNLISWWALSGQGTNGVLTDSRTTNTLSNSTPAVTADVLGPVVTGYGDSRRLISDFVKGIKSLGLWNSMVCWPLRSSQNANGTTAFSLGGLGRFDGTLVNAPTWGSMGINCATTSQRLTFGPAVNIQSYGGFTIFGTQIHRNLSSSSDFSLLTRSDGFWPESTFQAVSQSSTLITISTSPSRNVTASRGGTEQNGFHSYHATIDSNESGFLTINKTSPVAFGAPSTTGVPPTIDWTLNWSGSGVYAIHGVIRRYTQGQQAQLYDLYRQTLGLGLGLP